MYLYVLNYLLLENNVKLFPKFLFLTYIKEPNFTILIQVSLFLHENINRNCVMFLHKLFYIIGFQSNFPEMT